MTLTVTCPRTTYLPGTAWMNKVDGVCQPVEQPLDTVCLDLDLRPSNETLVSNMLYIKHHLASVGSSFLFIFHVGIHQRNNRTHQYFLSQSICDMFSCQEVCQLPYSDFEMQLAFVPQNNKGVGSLMQQVVQEYRDW